MRLERIITHRIIRLSRAVLPIVVIVLVAIPAWNYFARRAEKFDGPRVGRQLPSGVSVHTEGFTYSQTEGERTRFTVHAKQSLGYKDEKYMLEDVDVTVYGATAKDPIRTIRSKNCTYDQATNDFQCYGNVEVQLDEKTVVRSEELTYNHRDGIVTVPQRATLEQEGTVGHANTLEYGLNSGLLKLNGDVKVETADHAQIETASAVFQQKENWTTMSGGVLIKSQNGWIRGTTSRADLEPGTYKPTKITVEDHVTAESRSQSGREISKLRADWMEAIMSSAGTPERLNARGNVEVEKIAGDIHQTLSGNEIDTTLKDGKVDVLNARQNAHLVFGTDQTLDSSEIWTNGAGSVHTADRSVLKVGDSTIEGREFVIENGENIVTFNTDHPATLKKPGNQESASDQTRASFDSRTNMLVSLVQTGHFQFRTPQYQGNAQTGRFEAGGTVVVLEGSPVVTDSQKRLEAREIRIDQKDNTFVATRNVSTLITNPDEQVLVKAARAEGGAESITYTGAVELWRGEAYVKADRLKAAGQGGKNSQVHAEALPGSKVKSTVQNIRATSDSLDYDDALGVIRYMGHVIAQKQDMIVETPDMTVNFRDKVVTEIVASGGVTVTRADQRGKGERAVYVAATDVVTLTGKPAQVRDKDRLVEGPTLTMRNKSKSMSAEGDNGQRTTTKYRINNSKK
jgi:LPS export ABC transporter protein LptC/lipopolysaccharide transport protein LptA